MKYLKLFENFDFYDDDPRDDDPMAKWTEVIGHGKYISLFTLDQIEPTLRGLIRDNIDFDFYYCTYGEYASEHTEYLILLKGDWEDKLENGNLLPAIDGDQWYVQNIIYSDMNADWVKVDDVETFLDAKKYNL